MSLRPSKTNAGSTAEPEMTIEERKLAVVKKHNRRAWLDLSWWVILSILALFIIFCYVVILRRSIDPSMSEKDIIIMFCLWTGGIVMGLLSLKQYTKIMYGDSLYEFDSDEEEEKKTR